ncbi:metal-dependent transcriptional regulator [Arthrobacter jiangjiafuii]|uniref:Manganese transport regulator n=1 Tax=Arthrobacter jiangjiafuii TaxID=2817475 RepID=A0A975M7D3_9MICC|nr:metal-dependent transcriptional regulator [Arthrobacter jiangjiafuii]MBP3044317.1 metal-dependent transcriptional regulator [Arthrobacter jiangjiafuii]QWC11272.1 metal-dependent transcriptional regulator [Arthrobacter jiangjiafuii]
MGTKQLSTASEDYLKVIWTAQEWTDAPVTVSALSAHVGNSPSSVSEAVKKLTTQGLLTHARYGSITLTEAGTREAVAMVRRHRLIETFLVEYLDYGWDEVHDEAEHLEHAVSDKMVDALDRRLGYPVRDPHGDPIPSKDGSFPPLAAVRLSACEDGTSATIARVSDTDPELLRYLATLGLHLDVQVQVLARQAYAGTLTLATGGKRLELGLPAAQSIWVLPAALDPAAAQPTAAHP